MTLSWPTEEVSQVNGLQQIFQFFVLSREKCHYQSLHWITFGFSFRILVFLSFLLSLNVTVFSSRNPKKFRQTTLDWEWWMLCRSFFTLARKASDVQQLIGDIKHTWKISYFYTCVVTAFLGAGNPYITL